MASTIRLDIVTPEKLVYSEEIDFLEGPAIDGLIGILPHHAPLVTGLKTGILKVKKDGEMTPISISGGFMEVKPDQINVVVRTAELPHEINVERAKAARERAEERLNGDKTGVDETRAEAALERAMARIKAARKGDLHEYE